MQDDTSPELMVTALSPNEPYGFLNDGSRAARWISGALSVIAIIALVGNCLLTCPARFSERHAQDTSLLRPIVTALALGGRFPTDRGVEIRNLIFYVCAACLAILAGIRLMLATRSPRLSFDDLLDLRRRAASPCFWWIILLLVSFFSSYYSHAPDMCWGQLFIRLLATAWWWPLATLLATGHARTLSKGLVTGIGLVAALALWYYVIRVLPDGLSARLSYPIGNELWMGACLLPGAFVAVGLILCMSSTDLWSAQRKSFGRQFISISAIALALLAILVALLLTRSRSSLVGLAAGALTLACFIAARMGRRVLLLVGVLAALGGSFYVHRLLQTGAAPQRAQSIRSRLNYEWPYALHIFLQKPAAGSGDGAYAMLAGKLARDDQLDDPSTLRLDEWSWPGHAHNEYLELLCDLGIFGLAAYVAAIAMTLYWALRFCDRCPSAQRDQRWMAIGLAAALVACAAEQGGDPAIREPGLPPIFLTVWAALWAIARQQVPPPQVSQEGRPFPLSQIRLGGVAVCAVGAVLGWYGIQDWRGVRARFKADRWMDERNYAAAIAEADFAASHLLDPFRRALARLTAVSARSLEFDDALARSSTPPTDAEMKRSQDALIDLVALDHDAPRFLRVSRIASELHLNRARAFHRRGDIANEREAQKAFVSALMQNQKDEPFLLNRVQALWKVQTSASILDRLGWLRCLMRGGEIESGFLDLFRTLPDWPDFGRALNDLFNIASQDAARSPGEWRDRLSPETFRVAALAKALAGSPDEAAKLASSAQAMYAKAGPRLFAGQSAAIHEEVRYRFDADPLIDVDANLHRLANAAGLLGESVSIAAPLGGSLGETRLLLLVAARQDQMLNAQAAKLSPNDPEGRNQRLAVAAVDIARRCMFNAHRADEAVSFARRAVDWAPAMLAARATLLSALLQAGHDPQAIDAAEELLRAATDGREAAGFLAGLEKKYPRSAVWAQLHTAHPELRALAATQPATSQPHP